MVSLVPVVAECSGDFGLRLTLLFCASLAVVFVLHLLAQSPASADVKV